MWLFKRKKARQPEAPEGPPCSACGSRNSKIKVNFGNDQPDFVKTWRGRRFLTYHCFDCETDFSIPAPDGDFEIESQIGDSTVDDEEALREAEETLKRQTEEDGDHRFG